MDRSPSYLLPLHESLSDHLVESRLDEARGDRLAMAVAVSVVHYEAPIVLEVTNQLLQFGQQPYRLGTAIRSEFPNPSFHAG